MRKPAFYALVAVAGTLPLVVAGIALTRPSVRALVRQFVSPVATDAPTVVRTDGGTSTLPSTGGAAGGESIELRALAQLGQQGNAGARPPRKSALFEDAPPADPKKLPKGLKRSDLTAHDDTAIDAAVASLVQNDAPKRALTERIQRSGRYGDELGRILRAWKVPESLMALACFEGGFSPIDVSGDAVGIWRLTPDVATGYGLSMLEKYDERRGVALSTEAAGHYLADLRERFGSWELALYAYGIGYRAALAEVAAHSVTDFWASFEVLNKDGTDYVVRVLATAVVLGNLSRFGLDRIKLDDPVVTSDLEVPGGAPLSVVARSAGTSLARIRELNPEYLTDTVPSTKFAMIIHLPTEGLARAKELLMPLLYSTSPGLEKRADEGFDWGRRNVPTGDAGSVDAPSRRPANDGVVVGSGDQRRVLYRAREGDTLESVSRAYGVSPETVVNDNALDPAASLKPGTLLTLRVASSEGDGGSPPPDRGSSRPRRR